MRVLIAAAALLACAAAAPSGALLAAPYANHGLYAAAPVAVAHLAPALPTISSGDLQAAAIDAHVEASDHTRAALDAGREYHDQAAELHGQAINAAEDHSWQAVDAVKTHEAQLDGAAAGAAPYLAKSLVAPVAYAAHAAPVAYAAHAAPVAYAAHAAPVAYAAHAAPVAYAAHAAPVAYSAPVAYGGGYAKSISTQSLSQTHPSPVYHAQYAHAPVAYAAAPHYAHAW